MLNIKVSFFLSVWRTIILKSLTGSHLCHLNELHGQTSFKFLLLYRFHILNHITGGQTGSLSTEQLFKWIYWHVFSFYFCRTY